MKTQSALPLPAVLLLISCLLAHGGVRAAEPAPASPETTPQAPAAATPSPAADLAACLRRPVTVQFADTPLPEVLARLGGQAGVRLVLAPGAAAPRPVTADCQRIRLDLALNWLAREQGLVWEVRGGEILFSPPAGEGQPAAEQTPWDEIAGRALSWLVARQEPDGHWVDSAPPASTPEREAETTALALQALLSHQLHPDYSAWRASAVRAATWLKDRQRQDGSWTGDDRADAICAMALVRAWDGELPGPYDAAVVQAARRLLDRQAPSGGWGTGAGEIPAAAWAVLALRWAHVLGISVPPAVFDRTRLFLERSAGENAGVPAAEPARLIAAAAEELCGTPEAAAQERQERAADRCLSEGGAPAAPEAMFWASQLLDCGEYLHTPVGLNETAEAWFAWRQLLSEALAAVQVGEGDAAGSFSPAAGFGRVRTTALLSAALHY